MIPKSLTIFMELANDSWRDRILTGLTPLIVHDLFVVLPWSFYWLSGCWSWRAALCRSSASSQPWEFSFLH
jgi:hypothetical protein